MTPRSSSSCPTCFSRTARWARRRASSRVRISSCNRVTISSRPCSPRQRRSQRPKLRTRSLKAATSRREIAQTQKQRAEALKARGTLTQADLEQATLDLANAEAQVVTARVSVENARIAVDDTDIRAPISGTVIFKPVEKGQVISSPTQDFAGGTLLMQMADLRFDYARPQESGGRTIGLMSRHLGALPPACGLPRSFWPG